MFSWLTRRFATNKGRKQFDEQLNKELGEKYASLERTTDTRLPLDSGKYPLQ